MKCATIWDTAAMPVELKAYTDVEEQICKSATILRRLKLEQ